MSYSFNCRGRTKAEAKSNVSAELDKLVEQQPFHEVDRDASEKAVGSLIDLVRVPGDDEAILVNVSASGFWNEKGVENISLNVSVSFAPN